MKITSVILAAGQGKRMISTLPKILHPLLGRPLVWYCVENARKVTGNKPILIVGHGADAVGRAVADSVDLVLQEPQLGTGHAVMQAEPALRGKAEFVLVTYADMPLLTSETLDRVVRTHLEEATDSGPASPITMLTVLTGDPRGFGRIIRDSSGRVQAIVEEAQATPEQLAIRELNASVYCFSADWLWGALPRIPLSPKGEYYLTDLVGLAVADGLTVRTLAAEDPNEAIGINNRLHLSEAEAILRRRINEAWMLSGVTMVDPASTYIEPGVEIGRETVIWPNTYLQGDTRVGEACVIGPNAILRDTRVGDNSRVIASVLESALVEEHVDIGPFAHLRRGAHLARGVHMGNFGEVKDAYLGPGTKVGHFSYIGNATIGANVNIGAGTITCNYDGKSKNHTEIGEGVFIGSDTMLVAPIKVAEGARTGAGSVVTKNVPPNSLAVGVPARVIRKLEKSD